jgi:hypothetical protein
MMGYKGNALLLPALTFHRTGGLTPFKKGGMYVLKFIRKSWKTKYMFLFSMMFLWNTFYDFFTEKEFNVLFNFIRSCVFVLVFSFGQLIANSKDTTKIDE